MGNRNSLLISAIREALAKETDPAVKAWVKGFLATPPRQVRKPKHRRKAVRA